MALLQKANRKTIAQGVGLTLFLLAISYSSSVLAERPQLQILSATANADNTLLTIKGRYFVAPNDSAATVTFDDTILVISSISETEIQVVLPAQLNDGSFLLTVSRGNGALQNDQLFVTIQQEPRVFASAWSFDNSQKPRLIAQLEDTNGDGVVSVGDTVRTSEYPLAQDGVNYESFATTTHDVTFISIVNSNLISVYSGAFSTLFRWGYIRNSDGVSNYYDEFSLTDGAFTGMNNSTSGPHPITIGGIPCTDLDWQAAIEVSAGSPSGPQSELLYLYNSSDISLYEALNFIKVSIDLSSP